MEEKDEFKDIRPYNDNEIHEVLVRIAKHPWVAEMVRRTGFPFFPKRLFPLIRPLVRWKLVSYLGGMKSVDEFQRKVIVEKVLDTIRDKSTDGISSGGLESLDKTAAYLFISNHRDITLDPAYINYFLAYHMK